MISHSRLLFQGAARRLGHSSRCAVRRTAPGGRSAQRLWPSSIISGGEYYGSGSAAAFYTTERILELRTGDKDAHKRLKTLYDPTNEKENCGVGLIASLKSIPSRDIVEKADEMLVRMAHRGGCGCDPASGDGSGESDSWGLSGCCC